MSDRERAIAALALAGGDVFKAAMAEAEAMLTRSVMDIHTSPEDREFALKEYHALQRIRAHIQNWAYDGQQALLQDG